MSRSEPTQSCNQAVISIYLYIHLTCAIHNAHVRTTGKCQAGSFQVQRSHITLSPLLTSVLIPQPTIFALGWCQRSLNGSPYGHLHVTTTLCALYGESYALIHTCIYNRRVALLYQFNERAVYTLLMVHCHKRHNCICRACGLSTTTSVITPARPKCLALQYMYMYMVHVYVTHTHLSHVQLPTDQTWRRTQANHSD